MFVTIFFAVLDLETGNLAFSSAGHDDVVLLTAASACEPLGYMGPAIGLIETAQYPTATRTLDPGDTILLLTEASPKLSISMAAFSAPSAYRDFLTQRPEHERQGYRALAHG